MTPLTVQEQDELDEAIWAAAEGLKEVRKVLASIGERRGRKWYPDNPNHIRDMAGEVTNLFHEILILIVNRYSAKIGDDVDTSR